MDSDTDIQSDTPQPTPASTPGVLPKNTQAGFISQLKQITSSIDSAFACGGTIPIDIAWQATAAQSGHVYDAKTLSSIPPVVIRWDDHFGDRGCTDKIQFPSCGESAPEDTGVNDPTLVYIDQGFDSQMSEPWQSPTPSEASNTHLDALLRACQAATFGLNGQDVYDETYRRALKMDESKFCTNFHPADCGITDAIAQALLPAVASTGNVYSDLRGVHTELYKLNIYSGPSGRFKSHVDTPRGMTQFGSLVVCLPHEHKSGNLVVRHGSQNMDFDFASQSHVPVVQWAAFYSNCEHEVLEVESGHRITLTYNLYARLGAGQLNNRLSAMDPKSLPLYSYAQEMLNTESFLTEGGIMGFYCTHDYAHATDSAIQYLPWCLKGLDMIVYGTFQSLGCKMLLRPVYPNPVDDDGDEMGEDFVDEEEEVEELAQKIVRKMMARPGMMPTDDQMTRARDMARHKWRDEHPNYGKFPGRTVIGKTLEGLKFVDGSGNDDCERFSEILAQHMACMYMPNINWLNDSTHDEPAVSYMAYGNQAELAYRYSSAAIFIKVPPALKRVAKRT